MKERSASSASKEEIKSAILVDGFIGIKRKYLLSVTWKVTQENA